MHGKGFHKAAKGQQLSPPNRVRRRLLVPSTYLQVSERGSDGGLLDSVVAADLVEKGRHVFGLRNGFSEGFN